MSHTLEKTHLQHMKLTKAGPPEYIKKLLKIMEKTQHNRKMDKSHEQAGYRRANKNGPRTGEQD